MKIFLIKTPYMVIVILFVFGLFGSELVGFVKNQIEEKIKDGFTGREIMQAFLETLKENDVGVFTLKDAYFVLKDIYKKYFPENQFIEAKIRKIFQDMRNESKLDFLGVGKYKILE